jgi:hypothetical protein
VGVSAQAGAGLSTPGAVIEMAFVLGHETVETTAIAHMCKLDPRHIVGDSAGLRGDSNNLVGLDEEKLGLLIDEPSN